MDVLILGGTGFLSSALVAECQAAGHRVAIVTRGSAGRRPAPEGVETLHANRSEPESLRAALQERTFDLVIDSILYRPADAEAALDIFRGRTGHYVFISTDFVYGGEPRRFPLTEDSPRQALSGYGRDKAACEDVFFAAWEQEQFPVTILRPPHILGTGALLGTGSLQGRDPWLLWRLREGQSLLLLDGGALLIQPVHRTDIARACLAVSATEATRGRAYNIAGPDAVTTLRYYEMVAEIAGAPAPTALSLPSDAYAAAFPDRAPFTQNRLYAQGRLATDTGFTPQISLADALREMVTALDAQGLPEGQPPAEDLSLAALLRSHTHTVTQYLRDG